MLCPLAERQITSNTVSRVSKKSSPAVHTQEGYKKVLLPLVLVEMGMYGRERHSQFQRTGEKCECLAQQGVNALLTSSTMHTQIGSQQCTDIYTQTHLRQILIKPAPTKVL